MRARCALASHAITCTDIPFSLSEKRDLFVLGHGEALRTASSLPPCLEQAPNTTRCVWLGLALVQAGMHVRVLCELVCDSGSPASLPATAPQGWEEGWQERPGEAQRQEE